MNKNEIEKKIEDMINAKTVRIEEDKALILKEEDKSAKKVMQSRVSRESADVEILETFKSLLLGNIDDKVIKSIERVGNFKANNGKFDWTSLEGKMVYELDINKPMKEIKSSLAENGLQINEKGKIVKVA